MKLEEGDDVINDDNTEHNSQPNVEVPEIIEEEVETMMKILWVAQKSVIY